MKRRMIHACGALLILWSTAVAAAGPAVGEDPTLSGTTKAGSIYGKVIQVRMDSSGFGMVIFDRPVSGSPPTCVIDAYRNALAFNLNTAAGKGIMSLALSAKATETQLTVYGLGTCGIYGYAVEDWNYGQ